MHRNERTIVVKALVPLLLAIGSGSACSPATAGSRSAPDLAVAAREGELQVASRSVSELVDGGLRGARITPAPGDGIAWLEGVDFETGTIELNIRGKDVLQESFVGVAFNGADDVTYEAVYLRPFNFRAAEPVRRDHAVQYIAHPDYPWQRLRTERPEVFENPVDPAPDPNGWVPVRIVVERSRVLTFVGEGSDPDLVVDRLAQRSGRRVGLWVGNNSGGDFANLRITPGR